MSRVLKFYVLVDTQSVIWETIVFPDNHSHWYWQLKTDKTKYTKNTNKHTKILN